MRITLLFIACLFASKVRAEPLPERLSLQEARRLAGESNPLVAAAHYGARAADGSVLTADGINDVHIQASSSATGWDGEIGLADGKLELSKSFGWGTTFSAGAHTWHRLGLADERDSALVIGVRQPLLRGGFGSARADLEISARERDRARLEATGQELEVDYMVSESYWTLALSQEELRIQRQQLELAEKQLELTVARVEAGTVSPAEASAARQVIAGRRQDVLAAEQRRAAAALRLQAIIGLEPSQRPLEASDPLMAIPEPVNAAALLEAFRSNNPNLMVLRAELAASLSRERKARLDQRPQLDLALEGLSRGGPDSGIAEPMVRLSLTLGTDLFRREARGRAAEARALRRRDEELLRARENDERALLFELVAQSKNGEASLADAIAAVGFAEANIAAEQARFDAGVATNFDVLLRQTELGVALQRRARTLFLLRLTRARLGYLIGQKGK